MTFQEIVNGILQPRKYIYVLTSQNPISFTELDRLSIILNALIF